MIWTVFKVSWLTLRRDRVAQAMVFLLPIAFFSIFALVFGNQQNVGTSKVAVAVVDEDHSVVSARLLAGLLSERGLAIRTSARPKGPPASAPEVPLDRAAAEDLVRRGRVPVAIVLPRGLSLSFVPDAARPPVELLADPSDPVAPQVVQGLLQKVAMTAAPDLMMQDGITQFERYAGALTPGQRRAVDSWLPQLKNRAELRTQPGGTPDARVNAGADVADANPFGSGLVDTKIVNVVGQKQGAGESLVSFYAAGIGVMFLLFSCAAASGALLEGVESGTLEREISTRLGMGGLLAGKWLYIVSLGAVQLFVMFSWGALVFRLPFARHFAGWLVMTVFTCAAAAGLALVLATLCRTRAQLGGISTIVILVMSAVGGSMFPRFLMSEKMQRLGLFTFNAWALDGYIKVFWREARLVDLWPQVLVLGLITVVFLALARVLARRWETS